MERTGKIAVLMLGLTICASGCNPYAAGLLTPVPIQPWVAERMQEKYENKSDYRTPIMPPIREGMPPPLCEDPPDTAQVIRALPRVTRGVPYIYEEFRDDIQVVTEKIVDKIDPPRFFPLVGPAQLHHCHYKCTVYFVETIESAYPFPCRVKRPRVEVVYIDKDHLHLCVGNNPQVQQQITGDLLNY